MKFFIGSAGAVRSIHSEEARKVVESVGDVRIQRASHVDVFNDLRPDAQAIVRAKGEPVLDQWYADLGPSNGPVLGPFAAHADAIAAELKWLDENKIPAARR